MPHQLRTSPVVTWQKIVTYVLLLAALITFSTIAVAVWSGRGFWIDSSAFAFSHSLQGEGASNFFLFITFLGSSSFLLPANVILIVCALWLLRNKILALKLTTIAMSSLIFMYIFKYVFKRSRPEDFLLHEAIGYSFPSGHTLNSTVFFALLLLFLREAGMRKGWLLFFFIFFMLIVTLIGFSRIYLRVHYASDVLAGFSLALAWLIIAFGITRKMRG